MSLEKIDSGSESQLTKVLSGYAEFHDISLPVIPSPKSDETYSTTQVWKMNLNS